MSDRRTLREVLLPVIAGLAAMTLAALLAPQMIHPASYRPNPAPTAINGVG